VLVGFAARIKIVLDTYKSGGLLPIFYEISFNLTEQISSEYVIRYCCGLFIRRPTPIGLKAKKEKKDIASD
jgi:hypothetical protein